LNNIKLLKYIYLKILIFIGDFIDTVSIIRVIVM